MFSFPGESTTAAKSPTCVDANVKFSQSNECPINKLRIHYFFTQDEPIETLIKDTKIQLKLTTGPAWNTNIVASATAFPLKGLNEKLTKTAQKAEYMTALFVESTPQLFGYLRVN